MPVARRVSLVRPQLQHVKLYSHILQRQVQLKITPEVLRCACRSVWAQALAKVKFWTFLRQLKQAGAKQECDAARCC